MPRSYLQVILAIALLLGAGYYLTPGSELQLKVSDWQQALPKTYLAKARTWTYNEDGALTDVMEADRVTIYPSRKASLLESPRMYSHNLNDDTWSASANVGRYQIKREILTLSDKVVLTNDSNQVQLETEQLRINLRRNTAISNVAVTVTNGLNSTTADGMFADLDAQIVRLKPNVVSVYVPTPSKSVSNNE